MYCDRCGTPAPATQQFCGACGKPLATVPPASPARSMDRHIRLLGILWLAISAGRLLPAFFLLGFGRLGFHFPHMPHFVPPIMGFAGTVLLASAVAGVVAGWALLEREPWVRPLAIVLGVLSLFDFPLGTGLGIYTLWVLGTNSGLANTGRQPAGY